MGQTMTLCRADTVEVEGSVAQTIRPAALFEAVQAGDAESVKSFLQLGMDLEWRDKHDKTALHIACQYGFDEIAEILIAGGASVTVHDQNMLTPLLTAAIEGHAQVLRLLIENGADVNEVSQNGYTPLHLVLRHAPKPYKAAKTLINLGADPCATTQVNENPLHCACYNPDGASVVTLLLDLNNGINARARNDITALHIASAYSTLHCVIALIRGGADVTIPDVRGAMALHYAAQSLALGRCEVLEELLRHMPTRDSISAPDLDGWTPLHYAAERGQMAVVELLIAKGADLKAVGTTGCNLLHAACSSSFQGRRMVVEELIEHGLDPNVADDEGLYPIHQAAMMGNFSVIEELLRHDGAVWLRTRDLQTPMHLAARFGHVEVIKTLSRFDMSTTDAKDRNGATPLHMAAKSGHANAISALLNMGTSPTSRDERLRTPAHDAAEEGHIHALLALMDYLDDEQLNLVDHEGRSPLHMAVLNGHLEIAEELVRFGASPTLSVNGGESPLMAAQRLKSDSFVDLLSFQGEQRWSKTAGGHLPAPSSSFSPSTSQTLPGLVPSHSEANSVFTSFASRRSSASQLYCSQVAPLGSERRHSSAHSAASNASQASISRSERIHARSRVSSRGSNDAGHFRRLSSSAECSHSGGESSAKAPAPIVPYRKSDPPKLLVVREAESARTSVAQLAPISPQHDPGRSPAVLKMDATRGTSSVEGDSGGRSSAPSSSQSTWDGRHTSATQKDETSGTSGVVRYRDSKVMPLAPLLSTRTSDPRDPSLKLDAVRGYTTGQAAAESPTAAPSSSERKSDPKHLSTVPNADDASGHNSAERHVGAHALAPISSRRKSEPRQLLAAAIKSDAGRGPGAAEGDTGVAASEPVMSAERRPDPHHLRDVPKADVASVSEEAGNGRTDVEATANNVRKSGSTGASSAGSSLAQDGITSQYALSQLKRSSSGAATLEATKPQAGTAVEAIQATENGHATCVSPLGSRRPSISPVSTPIVSRRPTRERHDAGAAATSASHLAGDAMKGAWQQESPEGVQHSQHQFCRPTLRGSSSDGAGTVVVQSLMSTDEMEISPALISRELGRSLTQSDHKLENEDRQGDGKPHFVNGARAAVVSVPQEKANITELIREATVSGSALAAVS